MFDKDAYSMPHIRQNQREHIRSGMHDGKLTREEAWCKSVKTDEVLSELTVSFFFFQAEDGIRDLTVTGVQTCALPISRPAPARTLRRRCCRTVEPAPPPARRPSRPAGCRRVPPAVA